MGVPYAEVIGDPIAHSKSPLIHNFWLQKLGVEAEYRRTRVPAQDLPAFLAARRRDADWRGCNVTIPHKERIVPLLDERRTLFDLAAVNCVVADEGRLIGHNTDVSGVGAAIPECVDGDTPICIIGAGGAARAAVARLDVTAVFRFNVIARDAEKARLLVAPYGEFGCVFGFDQAEEAMRGCAGLINASPLGMDGFGRMPDSVLDSLALLRPGAFVMDMVCAPVRTELLRRASLVPSRWFGRRLHLVDGLTMLIGQAEEAFTLFFGEAPPPGEAPELRELLTR